MQENIEILGLFKDGWSIGVPANYTPAFLEFLRGKVKFSVNVSVIRSDSFPDLDIFTLADSQPEKALTLWIDQFHKSRG